jgi:hypothetical protein
MVHPIVYGLNNEMIEFAFQPFYNGFCPFASQKKVKLNETPERYVVILPSK